MVYILFCKSYRFLVVAHCDLSEWVETKPLRPLSSWAVTNFFKEDVICCYDCFGKFIIDGGSENKDAVAELTRRYGVNKVVVSVYHPQANKIIERGHKAIVDSLLNMSDGGSANWIRNLPAVL